MKIYDHLQSNTHKANMTGRINEEANAVQYRTGALNKAAGGTGHRIELSTDVMERTLDEYVATFSPHGKISRRGNVIKGSQARFDEAVTKKKTGGLDTPQAKLAVWAGRVRSATYRTHETKKRSQRETSAKAAAKKKKLNAEAAIEAATEGNAIELEDDAEVFD